MRERAEVGVPRDLILVRVLDRQLAEQLHCNIDRGDFTQLEQSQDVKDGAICALPNVSV